MLRLIVAVGLLALGAFATGCSASCEDMCNHLAECGKRLNPGSEPTGEQISECVMECEEGLCGEMQQDPERNQDALECLAELDCSSEAAANAGVQRCAAMCL